MNQEQPTSSQRTPGDIEPATHTVAPAQTPPPVKKRSSFWRQVALLLLFVVLIAAAVAGYLWMNRSDDKTKINDLKNDVSSLNERLGAAEDERAALENRLVGMQAAAAVGRGNDEQQIESAVRAYSSTFLASPANSTIKLSKRDGNQAVATVQQADKKYNVYLKKTSEIWQPVWAGMGAPAKEQRAVYAITIE